MCDMLVLVMSELVDHFISATESEDATLAKGLAKLSGDDNLHAVLACFDWDSSGALDDDQRATARRVLGKMHTPSGKGLDLLHQVLVYLDVNENKKLEHTEVMLAVEILELFCKADSVNDSLSAKELGMLLAALKKLDDNGNGVLDKDERTALRDGLWTPDEFLAKLLA